MTHIPVITIDGPSGSGKGAITHRLAEALGFHILDSGALYRLIGLAARRRNIALDAEDALVPCGFSSAICDTEALAIATISDAFGGWL